jgi:hypothetical protein
VPLLSTGVWVEYCPWGKTQTLYSSLKQILKSFYNILHLKQRPFNFIMPEGEKD